MRMMIFDLDGTLLDTSAGIIEAVIITLDELGITPPPPEKVIHYVGRGLRPLIADCLGSGREEAVVDSVIELYMDRYEEVMYEGTRPYPAVAETLDKYREKVKLVLSNKSRRFVNLLLRHFGLERYFERVLGMEDVSQPKPNPAELQRLLGEFGTPACEAVMIGDSTYDIEAGRRVRMHTCGCAYGFRGRTTLETAGADVIIDELSELLLYYC